MTRLFSKDHPIPKSSKVQTVSFRDFGGGWNAIDDDISMKPRYAVTLRNFRRTPSASQKVRFGNRWFADTAAVVNGNILDGTYFNGRDIVVTVNGEIVAIDDAGVKTAIWNTAIAALLPTAPSGWSTGLKSVNFVPFKDQLIIHNGVDKPIIISAAFAVTYLQDLATGSNINAPIGKYGCIASNYHCVAGITAVNSTTIYIANVGTAGTFPSDPAPNDAISIDVGAYAPEGAAAIRGLAGFRQYLLVFFLGQTLIVTLGQYNEALEHTPKFPDAMPQFGLLGHRCIVKNGNDILFAGISGVASAQRNLFSGSVDSAYISDLIEPPYRAAIGASSLSDDNRLYNCFGVIDPLSHDIIFHVPGGTGFTYSSQEKLHYKSWSEFSTPEWTCGWTSFLGRVFYAKGTRIYHVGNHVFPNEAHYADKKDDRDGTWAAVTAYTAGQIMRDTVTSESYTCSVSHTSMGPLFSDDRTYNNAWWTKYEGDAITFKFELPWISGKDDMQLKMLKYIKAQTKGTAEFTIDVYVDNLYKDEDGVVIYDPALSIRMIGNDTAGFGYDAGPFGGGRRSGDPRLQGFPLRCKSMKLIVSGSSRRRLEIISFSFPFAKGGYKR